MNFFIFEIMETAYIIGIIYCILIFFIIFGATALRIHVDNKKQDKLDKEADEERKLKLSNQSQFPPGYYGQGYQNQDNQNFVPQDQGYQQWAQNQGYQNQGYQQWPQNQGYQNQGYQQWAQNQDNQNFVPQNQGQ